MCQTRGGLKNALTCNEPSVFNIFGPQAPTFGSDFEFVDEGVDRAGRDFSVEIQKKNVGRIDDCKGLVVGCAETAVFRVEDDAYLSAIDHWRGNFAGAQAVEAVVC